MKNNFGTNISWTLFGESHGPAIGITLDGLPAGFKIDEEQIKDDMNKRKAAGKISTQRHEADEVHIISGYYNGYTTGTALTIIIENQNTKSKDYSAFHGRLRPGHADYTAFEKYNGYQDYRGGGHFSGRLTACIVAAGSICKQILNAQGILIGSHIESLYTLNDEMFSDDIQALNEQIKSVNSKTFALINEDMHQPMIELIEKVAEEKDSLGGILETAITGLPTGLGEPFFDSVESILSHLIFSVPAVKGVSFGEGFGFAKMKGSQANDSFKYEDTISTYTNHNAGINGGITNGMPIKIHTCIKPTPSIFKSQKSVDYLTKENVDLEIQGRHDPCILHRARIVVDSVVAFGILDLYMSRLAIKPLQGEQE